MSAPDDEWVRRYRDASEQEGARPGAHVRDAVRAHAQMVAAAPEPAAPTGARTAANQTRWKISALATVAVVGLTGLLMLQFERGTPEERDTAFSHRRAESPAPAELPPSAPLATPAAEPPSATPPAPAGPPDRARNTTNTAAGAMAPKPATPEPLAKAAPAPTPAPVPAPAAAVDALPAPRIAGAMSGFPASPPAAMAPEAERRARPAVPAEPALKDVAPAPQAAAAAAPHSPLSDTMARDDRAAAAAPLPKSLGDSLPGSVWDAARAGNTLQVENLIHQGVSVDARDNHSRTALMLAAMNGHTATIQKLLTLGANPALVDRDGLSAAQWARQRGHSHIADLLDAAR
ncbi:ankyrin repeat protein [Acidovorax sp. 69]|uniref:ankyrin repeat domain-containing protein n=1 Tax=Acidovorax sp. 69 TaxID=2035202 RepID=UPI000C230F3F|nr:ankyrin repeat domain-containing protein [Acidovorax sp. 69]PJI97844.1 ankyrin repeat protein [Acidovorax sp. 69]